MYLYTYVCNLPSTKDKTKMYFHDSKFAEFLRPIQIDKNGVKYEGK